ncbi:hypothetical protein [Demequina sp. NBRC 110051]|uniref:hypothetical protein n=1 Tax=Demequina sp. NBRC 110051 TaxID=1570340 RepID=UPI0009FD840A|nr:hypothetical protein [Demequina sp. NBRC 110051]
MRDARDAFDAAGQSAAGAITDSLAGPDALAVDVATASRRRRRRTTVRTGTACVAIVAAAASALTLRPEQPLESMAAADGTVGEALIMRLDDRVGGYCGASMNPEPYVPFGEPGVVIASDEVRDLGIEIVARPLELTWEAELTITETGHDGVVSLAEDPEQGLTSVMTAITVSWDGDALYDVDAVAYMVSGGRLISATAAWPVDLSVLETGQWSFDSPVPVYDAAEDRSSITYMSQMEPSCLGTLGASEGYPYLAPDLPTSLHTFVQVRDEDGTPLLTNTDAAGLDGTMVEFPGFDQAGLTTALEPATPEEIEDAEVAAAREFPQVPHRSTAAEVRDLVADTGVALSSAASGVRLQAPCVANARAVAGDGVDMPVVPTEVADVSLPTTLPRGAVTGDEWWSSLDEEQQASGEWSSWTQQGQLFLLDPATGALVSATPVQVDFLIDMASGNRAELVGMANHMAATCGEWPLPEAGTYRALLSIEYDGEHVEGLVSDGYGYLTTWVDAGEIALVD